MAEDCVMVAPGAKGFFPSSTDDATKPKNIIALSNPHARTTGFQGTRMYMADLRGRRAAHGSAIILRKTQTFRGHLARVSTLRSCMREAQQRQERRVAPRPEGLCRMERNCKLD